MLMLTTDGQIDCIGSSPLQGQQQNFGHAVALVGHSFLVAALSAGSDFVCKPDVMSLGLQEADFEKKGAVP